jgi:hypothetical protein
MGRDHLGCDVAADLVFRLSVLPSALRPLGKDPSGIPKLNSYRRPGGRGSAAIVQPSWWVVGLDALTWTLAEMVRTRGGNPPRA